MIAGPNIVDTVARVTHLGGLTKWGWMILQYPLAFGFLVLAFWLMYYILPDFPQHKSQILVGATMWCQQRLTITDPQHARMFVLMPIMMGYFATIYPIGVSIYMIVSTAVYVGEYLWVVGRPHPMISAPPKSQLPPPPRPDQDAVSPAATDRELSAGPNRQQPAQVSKGRKGAKRR